MRKITVSNPDCGKTFATVCSTQDCYCWDVSYLMAAIKIADMFGEYQLKLYGSEYYVTVVSDKRLSSLSLFLQLPKLILIPGKGDSKIMQVNVRLVYPFTI